MENNIKKLIEKGAEIGGDVSGVIIGLAVAGPVGAIGGAFAAPLIGSIFKKIGLEISDRVMGDREQIRVGATYALAANKIQQEIQQGNIPREDGFLESQEGLRSSSEIILEGTLQKARNEYEEKKLPFYASFLARINFDDSISFEKGNTYLRIVEQLSYRQLVILAYANRVDVLRLEKWMISFSRLDRLEEYQDFYADVMNLHSHHLLQQPGTGISMGVSSLKISAFGKNLCRLLEIEQITAEEIAGVGETIGEITRIIEESGEAQTPVPKANPFG